MYRLEMFNTSLAMVAHGQFKPAKAQLLKILDLCDLQTDIEVYAKTLVVLKVLLEHLKSQERLDAMLSRWSAIEATLTPVLKTTCTELEQEVRQLIKINHITHEVKEHWNQRYEEGYFYGKEANAFLMAVTESLDLHGKKILCLAEGQGRNSVYLAERGAYVTSVDISRVGLEKGCALAEEKGVADRMVWHEADLDVYEIESESWDYIVAIFMHLPTKIRQKVFTRVYEGLVPGGLFIGLFYRPEQLAYKTGGPKDKDFLVPPDAIYEAFAYAENMSCDSVLKEVVEGEGHTGLAAVLEVVIQK